MTSWKTEKSRKLADALLCINDQDTMLRFLRDLMTEPEIIELAGRFDVADALNNGKTQRTTAKETGVSIATVTRVNQWLTRGMNGYKDVLSVLSEVVGKTDNHHYRKA